MGIVGENAMGIRTRVEKHAGKRDCDKVMGVTDGSRDTCPNNAKIAIVRPDGIERYCGIHARDEWLRMAGIQE